MIEELMTRTRATFSKANLRRGILAVEESGHTVHAIEFPPGGGFKLILAAEPDQAEVNEWDVALGFTDAKGRPLVR